jgi:uncharacterized membrane protein YcaP (DUF421 family)
MNFYNKIMLKFWLIVAIVIPIVVTYLCITDSFKLWGSYYVFSIIALFMYFTRRWMMKRMEKHLKFLEEQKKSNS